LALLLALGASCHAILRKRDTRAALGWVGVIWLVPLGGALLYALLGINRIRRRAALRRPRGLGRQPPANPWACPPELLTRSLAPDGTHLARLAQLVGAVTRRPLLAGNHLVPLLDGGQAYAAMLQAIDQAARSVTLSTYIFDNDRAGRLFVEALRRARQRRVEVRVLVDDIGARYSWPPITRALRRLGVPFTGGMNIREQQSPALEPRHPIQDLHCRVEGPVVAHLQEAFAEDWAFCTGEWLQGERWFPDISPAGAVLARAIPDGPDEDFEKLRLTLLGALACAQSSVRLLTPYFLPDAALITSLTIAALRGVEVDILLPARNNLKLVQWAAAAQLWQLLERGCRVWLSPPPFDHTKLLVVDGIWVLLGTANWDPRSLRLNFEFNLECYDRDLAQALEGVVRAKLQKAQPLTLADVDGRSFPIKLRDGLARLLSPYL
jgi:cardiolipin synthase